MENRRSAGYTVGALIHSRFKARLQSHPHTALRPSGMKNCHLYLTGAYRLLLLRVSRRRNCASSATIESDEEKSVTRTERQIDMTIWSLGDREKRLVFMRIFFFKYIPRLVLGIKDFRAPLPQGRPTNNTLEAPTGVHCLRGVRFLPDTQQKSCSLLVSFVVVHRLIKCLTYWCQLIKP